MISDDLKNHGFSINSLKKLVDIHQGKLPPTSLDYFVILWIINDTTLILEKEALSVEKNDLVYIGPGKRVELVNVKKSDMYVVTFSASFYEKSAKDTFILNSELFFGHEDEIYVTKAIGSAEDFKSLIVERLAMYKIKANDLYLAVAHNCIESLLLDGLLDLQTKNGIGRRDYSSLKIVNQFKVLLQKNYKIDRRVSFYADLLHITPRRLSEMSEEILGMSAKQVIIDKVLKEGLLMLKHTPLTITEVMYELGFKDEGNFSAFFKTHTGSNPKELRLMEPELN